MSLAVDMAWVAVGFLILCSVAATHEAGHFMTARLLGIKVSRFAVGMGPRLIARTFGDTEFSLRLLPIGGYVALGPDDVESRDAKSPAGNGSGGIHEDRIPMSERFAISLAGSLTNFVVGFLVFASLAFVYGADSPTPTVGVSTGEAAAVGMRSGDTILEVDGQRVEDWAHADYLTYTALTAPEETLTLTVDRGGEARSFDIVPAGDFDSLHSLGLQTKTVRYNAAASLDSAATTLSQLMLFGHLLITDLAQATLPDAVAGLGGPVEIAATMTEVDELAVEGTQGDEAIDPLELALSVFAFLNVSVGLINLVPFPPLDGGRIALSFVRVIRGRSAPGLESSLLITGALLLLALMLAVSYHDIRQFFL